MYPRHYGTSGTLGQRFNGEGADIEEVRARLTPGFTGSGRRAITVRRREPVEVAPVAPKVPKPEIRCGPGEAAVVDAQGNVVRCVKITPTIAIPPKKTAVPVEPERPVLKPEPDVPMQPPAPPPTLQPQPPAMPPEFWSPPTRPPVNGDIMEPLPPDRPVVNGAAVPTKRLPWETQVPLPIPGARPARPPAAPLKRAADSVREGVPIQRAGLFGGDAMQSILVLSLLSLPLFIFGRRTR